ncbi:hypothetical protein D5086_002922 [Populus alba]|uniref:Uncharacterized protein n=1 Tax=Populus alba TaxID=43335 RepID=A0ACC4D345_POPAL
MLLCCQSPGNSRVVQLPVEKELGRGHGMGLNMGQFLQGRSKAQYLLDASTPSLDALMSSLRNSRLVRLQLQLQKEPWSRHGMGLNMLKYGEVFAWEVQYL